MTQDCKHEDIIDDMKKALFGNSRKGLIERVTSLGVQMKVVMSGIGIIITMLIKLIFFGG